MLHHLVRVHFVTTYSFSWCLYNSFRVSETPALTTQPSVTSTRQSIYSFKYGNWANGSTKSVLYITTQTAPFPPVTDWLHIYKLVQFRFTLEQYTFCPSTKHQRNRAKQHSTDVVLPLAQLPYLKWLNALACYIFLTTWRNRQTSHVIIIHACLPS